MFSGNQVLCSVSDNHKNHLDLNELVNIVLASALEKSKVDSLRMISEDQVLALDYCYITFLGIV